MERILQYLDDLDDLFGTFGLLAERLRGFAALLALIGGTASAVAGGVMLALAEPPLGLAVVILLFVILLYRSVTGSVRSRLVSPAPADEAASAPVQP